MMRFQSILVLNCVMKDKNLENLQKFKNKIFKSEQVIVWPKFSVGLQGKSFPTLKFLINEARRQEVYLDCLPYFPTQPTPPSARGGLGVFAFYDVPSWRFAPGFSHFFVFTCEVHISVSLDVRCHGIRGAQAWVSML